jgi:selenocysteine lyase/cysteine desulfurase
VIERTFPEPTVMSSENDPAGTPFWERYIYTGTRDYTAYLTIADALDFRSSMGGDDQIFHYCSDLAAQAADELTTLWETRLLAPNDMQVMMINVELPTSSFELAQRLQRHLLEEHNMYIIVLQEPRSKIVYTRLSAQIYLGIDDFRRLGLCVKDYLTSAAAPEGWLDSTTF